MMYREFVPHPALRPYVHSLCVVGDTPAPGEAREIWPDSFVELVFGFGAPVLLEDGRGLREAPRCYRIGVLAAPFTVRALGATRMVRAQLYAWGAAPLLGVRGVAAGGPIVPLEDGSWPRLAGAIERALWAGDEAGAIGRLQDFLLARVGAPPTVPGRLLVAAQELRAAGGQLAIHELAARSALSTRQLERAFRALGGIAPKALARTMRFERVRDHLLLEPQAEIADLAYRYGYADQAHLTREFKAFAGRTPARVAAELRAGHPALRAYHVAFLQEMTGVPWDTQAGAIEP